MNTKANKQQADLLEALCQYGLKNPGQWVIPGWDGNSIARAITNAGVTERAPPSAETVDLVGLKNGQETKLGTVPMPPRMKLREIMRQYFRGDPDDEDSEVAMAVAAGMEFFDWLTTQGYSMSPSAMPSDEQIEDFLASRMTNEGRIPMIRTIREALVAFGTPNGYRLVSDPPTDVELACMKAAINDMNDGVVVQIRHVAAARQALLDTTASKFRKSEKATNGGTAVLASNT